MKHSLEKLNRRITRCRLCPRLVDWRKRIAKEKVARYCDQRYWGKPVPGFGDPHARLLIVGLAPAAHGANRTGRMFTGDRSGEWLYRTLHRFGFANQSASLSADDGLHLSDCYITAAARCAPPQNKLLPMELLNCRQYLLRELDFLRQVRVIIALGRLASITVFDSWREYEGVGLTKRPAFRHGGKVALDDHHTLLMSYHPSQQNTFTGKLTQQMFDSVFKCALTILA